MSSERPEILQAAASDRAYRDDLTGLFNYRLLAELFADGWDLLAADGALSLVILDLDLFKDVNDTHGHLTGNKVLEEVAELLQQSFRQDDVLIRYGGDEFVILCPGAVREVAEQLAYRTREVIDDHDFQDRDTGEILAIEVSFSVGLASFPEDGRSGEEILAAADRRLFEDKMSRRRARRSGRSSRERLVLPALGILVVALLAVINAMVERWSTEPVEISRPLPGEQRHQELVPFESRETEMQLELERLRTQVANLLAVQPGPESENAAAAAEYEGMISAMQARIDELQDELVDSAVPEVDESKDPESVGSVEASSQEIERPADRPQPRLDPEIELVHPEDPEVAITLPPRLIHLTEPLYPPVARRMRREAVIELRLIVDLKGRVVEATPIGPLVGLGFEDAARKAALRAVYTPGSRDGVAVASETNLTVKFRLSSK